MPRAGCVCFSGQAIYLAQKQTKIPRTPTTCRDSRLHFRDCFPSLYQGTCVNTEYRARAQPVWFKVWLCPQKQSGDTSFLPAPSLTFTTRKMGRPNKARVCMLPEATERTKPHRACFKMLDACREGKRKDPHLPCTWPYSATTCFIQRLSGILGFIYLNVQYKYRCLAVFLQGARWVTSFSRTRPAGQSASPRTPLLTLGWKQPDIYLLFRAGPNILSVVGA